MSEPAMYSVPLEGSDKESRAINAVVFLIEKCNFDMSYDMLSGMLGPAEKDRIARYLLDRYEVQRVRAE
jgi:hypothetical protein